MSNGAKPARVSGIMKGLAGSFDASLASSWYSNVVGFLSGSRSFYVLLIISGLIVFAGAMMAINAINMGYRHAYGVSREIPWGILISTYIFFVVTSTGLCIISSIGHVFGVKDFIPIAKRSVFLSVATIFAGFTVIFFDIENPFRMMLYNALSPNLTSNIWWMGTLYGAYMVFMAVEFVFLLLEQHKIAMYAGLAGLLSGIAAHSNLGAIFGMLHGREYWYGPYMPIYFIASAMMSGCAAIIFFTWLGYKVNNEMMDKPMARALEVVAKLWTVMIAVIMFFTAWKFITGIVAPGKYEVMRALFSGPYAVNFWFFEILLGMAAPFAILLISRWRDLNMMFAAAAMQIVGIFFMRLDLVAAGQIVPSYFELGVKEYSHLLTYHPSIHEIMIITAGMGVVAMSFLLAEKVFKGHKVEIH